MLDSIVYLAGSYLWFLLAALLIGVLAGWFSYSAED
jgi:hypothetical protein